MMAIQAQLYPDSFGFSLGGSQSWMENSYGFNEFCLNLQQKHQQQLLQNLQQKTQNPFCETMGLLSKNNNYQQPMALSQSTEAQVEKQGQQIDRFISLQVRNQINTVDNFFCCCHFSVFKNGRNYWL